MKEIKLKGLDQSVFYEELSNGLKVILLPFKNKTNYYINYTTKYGSINLDFIPNGSKKMYSSPKGIAHFLEHKLFEQEDGESPFEFYSKSGTASNAGTSYKRTSYYLWGVNKLEENLDYLISCVNKPYFTDSNVEKEKGIIIQELNMYMDNPDSVLTNEVSKATYKNHPIRYDIGGYPDTVSKITKEDLYTCYDTFYSPSNMILAVSGNFDVNKILDLIKSNEDLMSRKSTGEIIMKDYKEPLKVLDTYKEITVPNLAIPKVAMNVKISLKGVKDLREFIAYVMAYVGLKFASASDFKEEILTNNYATSFTYGAMLLDGFYTIELYAETNKPNIVIDKILKELKSKSISSEDLERYKKVKISYLVMESDNIEASVENAMDDLIVFGKIFDDEVDFIRGMNIDKFNEVMSKVDFSNHATVVLK